MLEILLSTYLQVLSEEMKENSWKVSNYKLIEIVTAANKNQGKAIKRNKFEVSAKIFVSSMIIFSLNFLKIRY